MGGKRHRRGGGRRGTHQERRNRKAGETGAVEHGFHGASMGAATNTKASCQLKTQRLTQAAFAVDEEEGSRGAVGRGAAARALPG